MRQTLTPRHESHTTIILSGSLAATGLDAASALCHYTQVPPGLDRQPYVRDVLRQPPVVTEGPPVARRSTPRRIPPHLRCMPPPSRRRVDPPDRFAQRRQVNGICVVPCRIPGFAHPGVEHPADPVPKPVCRRAQHRIPHHAGAPVKARTLILPSCGVLSRAPQLVIQNLALALKNQVPNARTSSADIKKPANPNTELSLRRGPRRTTYGPTCPNSSR